MKTSAGLLLYRQRSAVLEVFLVHPGGPFWARRDDGAWSIPKGGIEAGEDALDAARREFTEETGFTAEGEFVALKPVKQAGGKVVHAWAVEGDVDAAQVRSNTFLHNGREYPEVDRAAWFTMAEARRKLLSGQVPLLDELARLRSASS
jgi:predicted NUDIX family NTP pyrophosphohydrolase